MKKKNNFLNEECESTEFICMWKSLNWDSLDISKYTYSWYGVVTDAHLVAKYLVMWNIISTVMIW